MVMKAMLIGLLVIGTVVMLETDVNAWRHCRPWLCLEFTPKELEKVVAEVRQHEGIEVWLLGFTEQVGSSAEFGRVEHEMEHVRQALIQRELPPDIFRSMILEGYAPQDPKQREIKIIVAWRERQYQ